MAGVLADDVDAGGVAVEDEDGVLVVAGLLFEGRGVEAVVFFDTGTFPPGMISCCPARTFDGSVILLAAASSPTEI